MPNQIILSILSAHTYEKPSRRILILTRNIRSSFPHPPLACAARAVVQPPSTPLATHLADAALSRHQPDAGAGLRRRRTSRRCSLLKQPPQADIIPAGRRLRAAISHTDALRRREGSSMLLLKQPPQADIIPRRQAAVAKHPLGRQWRHKSPQAFATSSRCSSGKHPFWGARHIDDIATLSPWRLHWALNKKVLLRVRYHPLSGALNKK